MWLYARMNDSEPPFYVDLAVKIGKTETML